MFLLTPHHPVTLSEEATAVQLLVSVRSAEEGEAALAGGAGVIDVKEPLRGPLGRADDEVVRAVAAAVAGRRPVSAALGELAGPGEASFLPPAPLAFVKWGLAGAAGLDWREEFAHRARRLAACAPGTAAVIAAYADAERAGAPPVAEVVEFVCRDPRVREPARAGACILLVDTFDKGPSPFDPLRRLTLLDWLSPVQVTSWCQQCRAAGVRVALAGSLGVEEIGLLLPARPGWFAVRGAACPGQDRRQGINAERVRCLADLLQTATRGS